MKAHQTLIFLCSVLLLVVGICLLFPENGVTVGDKTFRFCTLEEAMTKKSKDTETAEDKLKKAEAELRLQIETDSLRCLVEAEQADSLAYVDTLKSYQKLLFESSARIDCPNNDPSILFPLFDCLDKCAKGKESIHILHYGDSQIEQDRISGYIREQLQAKFGGWGAGLVPAIQPIPSISVGQTASDSLPRYIADGTLRQKLSHNRYGVLAQMAQLEGGTVTLSFTARDWKKTFAHTRKFSKVTLLIGNTSENFKATLKFGKKSLEREIKNEEPDMSVLTWQLDSFITSFSLQLNGKAEIYGVSMDSKSGVAVDNIPLRGSSGTFFTRLSSHLMSESMEALDVRLVMMEFGGNMTPHLYNEERIEKYKGYIGSQIAHIKKIYPKALILFIGPADMSKMVDGELQTYPLLEQNIAALRDVALENGAMFWNMYEVMGGYNSMLKWVEHKPSWAAPDYIHFTEKGAGRIADVFIQSFMNSYEYYHFLKKNKKWSNVK